MSEYGYRIYSDDFKNMTWDEFSSLLCGLGADSPLVRIVRIRSEKDRDVLKHFTKEQHKIRSAGSAGMKTIEERDAFLRQLAGMFRKGR